jgi:hypothetical protein
MANWLAYNYYEIRAMTTTFPFPNPGQEKSWKYNWNSTFKNILVIKRLEFQKSFACFNSLEITIVAQQKRGTIKNISQRKNKISAKNNKLNVHTNVKTSTTYKI